MNETVLITGGSRGIGRAAAILFAKEGYNVAINYNNSKKEAYELEKLLEEYSVKCFCADVSDSLQVGTMFNDINSHFGAVDVLVNNAGISQQKFFIDIALSEWQNMFDIHVNGMFNCTQAALPNMMQKRNGKIINISSIWGMVGASCEVHYSAAKAAMIGFTKALAKEVGGYGINVNCIAPGAVKSDMNKDLDEQSINSILQDTPLLRLGTCMDIANAILFLASYKSSFITGQIISPNGGMVIV